MAHLQGKTALVTGASGGIGQAIAEVLHKHGATVGLSGTNQAKLNEVRSALGDRAFVLPADLSSREAVKQLVKDAETALGKIDILICNAGITKDNLALRMSEDDWDNVLNVNLTAPFLLAKTALRGMMKLPDARIIFIGSIVGTTGNPGQANYVASKAGLAGLAKTLAYEVSSRNVTVNTIAPGFIATPMTEKLTDAQKEAMMKEIPLGRFGSPADVAEVAAFLAGSGAGYITGQTIHVNGGMVMP